MSLVMRGAKPYTVRYDVDNTGGRYALPALSAELIIRPQSGNGRLYWNQASYDAQQNYVELNGDAYSGEFRVRAAVDSIWLSGPLEIEITILGQA